MKIQTTRDFSTERSDLTPYFKHLCHVVRPGQTGNNYQSLLLRLYEINFYSMLPNDDNREKDGEQLRFKFGEQNDDFSADDNTPCSILEMLIALAYRMSEMIVDEPFEMNAGECFWLFMKNLNIEWMDNHNLRDVRVQAELDGKIRGLLLREYDRNGIGGIFPLGHSKNDQRKTEIWYQMSEYLLENYDF